MKKEIKDYMNLDPKATKTYYEIINKENIDRDIKIYCILELVHSKKLSLKAAYELCTKQNIFKEDWISVDTKTTEIFEKLYKNK